MILKQTRLDALADGIFAIAMTILVFEIQIPEYEGIITNVTLLESLIKIYPLFLSYLLSFSLLFTYWRAHHYVASVLAKNANITLSNLSALFFLFVGLVPFFSRFLGKYYYTEVAIIAFATNIIIIGLLLWIMRRHVIMSTEIEKEPFTHTENKHANMRILLPVVAAIIAIILAFFHKTLALSFFTIAILFNLSRRSTRYASNLINLFYKKERTVIQ